MRFNILVLCLSSVSFKNSKFIIIRINYKRYFDLQPRYLSNFLTGHNLSQLIPERNLSIWGITLLVMEWGEYLKADIGSLRFRINSKRLAWRINSDTEIEKEYQCRFVLGFLEHSLLIYTLIYWIPFYNILFYYLK
jgi:hypothetical protein